jgi:uncharacterized membrane protein
MAKIGKTLAPARFIAFILLLAAAVPLAGNLLHDPALGAMAGFDAAALVFVLSCLPLLWVEDPAVIRDHANDNDANRTILLAITGVVMVVLLLAVAAETMGDRPQPFTKALVIVTLIFAWLFSNTIYALHYAHLAYRGGKETGCEGLGFPGTTQPAYLDFVYFAFTLGMTFQTSDVTISDSAIRRTVTLHCLAAFAFNIGVLAFTINVLGGP